MRSRYHPARSDGTIFNRLMRNSEEHRATQSSCCGGVGLSETMSGCEHRATRTSRTSREAGLTKVDCIGLTARGYE